MILHFYTAKEQGNIGNVSECTRVGWLATALARRGVKSCYSCAVHQRFAILGMTLGKCEGCGSPLALLVLAELLKQAG